MNETLMWIIVGICLIGVGFLIYLIGAIPLMIFQKKEVKCFDELANRFNFEKKLGKAGLTPNFPIIKGFYNRFYFIVKKARSKNYSFMHGPNGTMRVRRYFIEASTKIKNPGLVKFRIDNRKKVEEGLRSGDFDQYIVCDIEPKSFVEKIITADIKEILISLAIKAPYYRMELDKDILASPNFNGLYKPEDVETCAAKIEVLSILAAKIYSLNQ